MNPKIYECSNALNSQKPDMAPKKKLKKPNKRESNIFSEKEMISYGLVELTYQSKVSLDT